MYSNPYQTTPCADYNLARIEEAIKLAEIEGTLQSAKSADGNYILGLTLVTSANREIPPFAHPLYIKNEEKGILYLDVRGCTRVDREGKLSVSSKTEYDFALLRGKLSRHWLSGNVVELLALGQLPLTVYARWISENITRRFGLDPLSQMKATIVAGFFFLSMFREEAELTEQEKIKFAGQISRATRIPVETILEHADSLTPMSSVKDLVTNLITVVGNVRLEKLSTGLLYASLGGSWFGGNANETSAVALEHPPTFLAMVFTSLHERGYRNAGLAKVVLNCDKGDLGKSFSYHLLSLPNNPSH